MTWDEELKKELSVLEDPHVSLSPYMIVDAFFRKKADLFKGANCACDNCQVMNGCKGGKDCLFLNLAKELISEESGGEGRSQEDALARNVAQSPSNPPSKLSDCELRNLITEARLEIERRKGK